MPFFINLIINLLRCVGWGGAFGFNTGMYGYDNFSFQTNDFSIFVMVFLPPRIFGNEYRIQLLLNFNVMKEKGDIIFYESGSGDGRIGPAKF